MLNNALETSLRFKCTNLSALVSWSVTCVYFISPAQITPMHRMKAPKRKENVCEEEKKIDEDTVNIGQRNQPVVQFPSTSASLQDATLLGQFNNLPYQHIHIDNGVKYLVDEKSKTITTTNNSDVFTNNNTSF